MGSGIPLLNDYKQEFFWKRFPQSVLGGPKLRLGYDAPPYVYINQLVLFVLPLILGVALTAAAEVSSAVASTTYAYVFAALMFLFVLIVNIISFVARAKKSSISPIMTNARNILAEDDEVQFESCCGIETIEFVVPGKKFKVNIVLHALISAAINGLGLLYLLPTNLKALYGDDIAATVIVCGLGWVVLIIAQYSLTVAPPPEWATFRTIDTHENYTPLMRPFYVGVCCGVDVAAMYFPNELLLANQVLHVVFIFLPFLWTIGFLPPLDAMFLWLFEQAHTVLLGGSHMATDIRTVIYLVLSVIVYIAAYFIPLPLASVIIMAAMGYLLSIDLAGLGYQLIDKCSKTKSETLVLMKNERQGFLWFWTWKEALFHTLMFILATGVATALFYVSTQADLSSIGDYMGYGCMGVLVLVVVLGEMQSVYVLLGLWRNKLFPHSVTRGNLFRRRKKKLNVLGMIRRILMDFVAPLLMMAYLGISLRVDKFDEDTASVTNATSSTKIMDVMGATRAFRWAWQSSQHSLLEISLAQILSLALPVTSSFSSLSLGVRLLLLGFLRDRLGQTLNKLYVFFTLIVTSWTDKKQRRRSTIPWMVVNVILFPLVLMVITLASSLSAPLLPLFTLPIFLIGFARPLRFWPSPVGTSANVNADTVYYKQLVPQLARAMRKGFANGSLGDPSPGLHFIVRFQDRLAWVHVLERGYSYCTISIKGLELQETSCHTVEASRIDDIIELAFERENAVSCCTCNQYPLCILRPRDAAILQTYSDAKNQLTGLIDSPDTLKMVVDGFLRTLTWVLLNHVHKTKQDPHHKSIAGNIDANSRPTSRSSQNRVKPEPVEKSGNWQKLNNKDSPRAVQEQDDDTWHVKELARPPTRGSLASFGGMSTWSDNDSLLGSPDKSPSTKPNLVSGLSKSGKSTVNGSSVHANDFELQDSNSRSPHKSQAKQKQTGDSHDVDNLFEELGFGMPVLDVNQPKTSHQSPLPAYKSNKLPRLFPHNGAGNNTVLSDPSRLKSPLSTLLAPPSKWQEVPIDSNKLNTALTQFPVEWYKRVLGLLKFEASGSKTGEEVGAEIGEDEELRKVYGQLVMACHMAINVLGVTGTDAISMGTMHVHKVYSGDIPWSVASEWITEDPEFNGVVLKAYRYAVKLAVEQAIMGGEPFSLDELQEYMEEFDEKWYIGTEKDPEWIQAVEKGQEQLFSFTYDAVASVYNSRVLSILDTPVYISSVNGEVVRAQWANLNLELFYMTNDDEERYSIQAHPTILRNLTVQAADPPLGYPIYASEPISVPTL